VKIVESRPCKSRTVETHGAKGSRPGPRVATGFGNQVGRYGLAGTVRLPLIAVALLLALALAGTALGSPNPHGGQDCGSVAFAPRTDDGAFELRARNVSCKVARAVARAIDADKTRPLSFRCRGRTETGPGLPHSHWLCIRGSQEVSWVGSPAPGPGQSSGAERVCGLLPPPGGGASSYIETWSVSCRVAWRISRRAVRKFCAPAKRCRPLTPYTDRGLVRIRRWRCEVRKAHENTWVRCLNGRKRFVSRTGS